MASKHYRNALAVLFGLSFVLVAPLGAVADTAGTTGVVVESTRNLNSADYTVATDVPADKTGQIIGGRGASFAFQWWATTVDDYNAQASSDDEIESAYGSCGSSCGRRGILNLAQERDEGYFTCDSVKYAGSCNSLDEVESRWTLFSMSDAPPKTSEYARAEALGGELLTMPLTIGTVTVSYNHPNCGDGDIRLDGSLISRMYRGNEEDGITKWNHPDLVALNGCLAGLNLDIQPVIRCDGSGTTFAFSDYMARSAGSPWTASDLIDDVTQNEICGPQNDGVADHIQSIPGAFGYVELAQAQFDNLDSAALLNADGTNYVQASPETGSAAADGAAPSLPPAHGVWTDVSIAYAPGDFSYPVATFTYALAWANPWDLQDPDSGLEYTDVWTADEYAAVKDLLTWAFTEGGEFAAPSYAPIGPAVQAKNLAGIARMHYGERVDFTADVLTQGYPAVGQTVSATDSSWTLVEGGFTPVPATDVLTDLSLNGEFVEITGSGYVVNGVGSVDGVVVRARGDAAAETTVLGEEITVRGQVLDGTLLVFEYA